MAKYVCNVCGYEYDPEVGDPDNGIAPGTAWEDVPEDWENYGDEEVTCIIEAKKTAKAEFGNKYIRPYGNLEISKNISPEYAPEQEFEFTVSGLGNGVYDYTVSGDNGIYTIRDGGTIKLTGGKTATITDIPKDSVVTVTETNIPKDWALMSDEQVSCTIIVINHLECIFKSSSIKEKIILKDELYL